MTAAVADVGMPSVSSGPGTPGNEASLAVSGPPSRVFLSNGGSRSCREGMAGVLRTMPGRLSEVTVVNSKELLVVSVAEAHRTVTVCASRPCSLPSSAETVYASTL
jgi:hypothetical protein